MEKQTFGAMISALRREKGMTQLELAEKMGVTDKAVSKWERDLSFPDVNTIPKLAEIFNLTVDELMRVKASGKTPGQKLLETVGTVLKGVALAMGVAVVALSTMGKIETSEAISLLGIGLTCLAVTQFSDKKE